MLNACVQDWAGLKTGEIQALQEDVAEQQQGLTQVNARMDSAEEALEQLQGRAEQQLPPPPSGAHRARAYLRRAWPAGAVLLAAVPIVFAARWLVVSRR